VKIYNSSEKIYYYKGTLDTNYGYINGYWSTSKNGEDNFFELEKKEYSMDLNLEFKDLKKE